MPSVDRRIGLLVIALALGIAGCSREYVVGSIVVSDPWSRATPPGGSVGAGYMKISNHSARAIRLLGGSTDVAEKVEIHAMTVVDGVMRMRPLADGLEIPADGAIELKPSGMHLMLIGLKRALAEGEEVPLTLNFDGHASVLIDLRVEKLGGS